jgi:hypothetical protein
VRPRTTTARRGPTGACRSRRSSCSTNPTFPTPPRRAWPAWPHPCCAWLNRDRRSDRRRSRPIPAHPCREIGRLMARREQENVEIGFPSVSAALVFRPGWTNQRAIQRRAHYCRTPQGGDDQFDACRQRHSAPQSKACGHRPEQYRIREQRDAPITERPTNCQARSGRQKQRRNQATRRQVVLLVRHHSAILAAGAIWCCRSGLN